MLQDPLELVLSNTLGPLLAIFRMLHKNLASLLFFFFFFLSLIVSHNLLFT